ncbi:MAG TPA: glycosyltransferase family 4 protein [Burkholderiales bacterium]|nr:glycosyltransferase family 4 protein [Burkholderiales bacterium]
MRVLITNLFVANFSGSETVVELLADALRRVGHTPMIFAPTLGPQAERMRARSHIVVDRLARLPQRPDVMHLQHITPALMALVAFPDVPAVFTCHSATIELEAPRLHPQIRRYVAVDDFCRALCVKRDIQEDRLSVILNAVDLRRFNARPPLPPKPKTALLLTKTFEQQNLVRSACARAGLTLDELGPATKETSDQLEQILPRYDIVFATARMALEAATVGCAVVVADGRGFAGMLRSENLKAWRRLNFGVGLLTAPVTAAALDAAIAAYDAADAAEVCGWLRAEASADDYAAAYLQLYTQAIGEAVAQDSSQAAATAAWLEDLLPSAAPRAWLEVTRETGLALEACFGRRRGARLRSLLRSLPFPIRSLLRRWWQ